MLGVLTLPRCRDLESLKAPTHGVLCLPELCCAWWYSRHTRMHNTGNSTNSVRFFRRNFHISPPWNYALWLPTHLANCWCESWSASPSGFHCQGLYSLLYILGKLWHHGVYSFVEYLPSSEDKHCVNMAAVLDQWVWSCTQSRILLHEDCLARFLYPCLKAETQNGFGDENNNLQQWSLVK